MESFSFGKIFALWDDMNFWDFFPLNFFGGLFVDMEVRFGEEDEADFVEVVVLEEIVDGLQGDGGGLIDGVAVSAGTDGREGDGFKIMINGDF